METIVRKTCTIVFSVIFISCQEIKTVRTEKDMEQIEKTINDVIGWAVTKDFDLLYRSVSNGSEYIEVDPDTSVIKGFERFRKNERIWKDPAFRAIGHEIRDLKISVSKSGDAAWWYCILDDKNEWNGKPASWLNTRWTGVLEKRNGKWTIVQMHFSFPS